MLIAHISDPHLTADGAPVYGLVDADTALARVVDAVNALSPCPDVALVTGDLTHDRDVGAARRAAAALAVLRMPVFVAMGNHDDRAAIRAAFGPYPGDSSAAWMAYAVDAFPLRLLALDAATDAPFRALLPPAELDWLAARLAEAPARPTLVFLHHPSFDTGIDWLDSMGIAAGRRKMGEFAARPRRCRGHSVRPPASPDARHPPGMSCIGGMRRWGPWAPNCGFWMGMPRTGCPPAPIPRLKTIFRKNGVIRGRPLVVGGFSGHIPRRERGVVSGRGGFLALGSGVKWITRSNRETTNRCVLPLAPRLRQP